MTTEVERKWLLDEVPSVVPLGEGTPIRQGYVARDGEVEVRIRMTGDAAELTVKAGRGLTRTEVGLDLDIGAAGALWPHTAGRRIEKVRYRVPVDVTTAEVDVYGDALSGLLTVEVEFPSETAATAFVAPSWFGREVTGDGRWSNASLAEHGLPG